MYSRGLDQYHWKTELNRRLKLPVYDGVEEKLQKQNERRKRALDAIKTEEKKKERVVRKSRRQRDAFCGLDNTDRIRTVRSKQPKSRKRRAKQLPAL